MELQCIKDNLETEQVLQAKPTQVTVEAEAALPGGLREEARVYYADAAAHVHSGELTGGRITAEGRVVFHALYAQGDMRHVAALETAADFTQALPLKEENASAAAAAVRPRAQVQYVSAKAFNGRLLLRAVILLSAEASLPRTVSYIRDLSENKDIQKEMQVFSLQRKVGEGEGQTLLKEEVELSDVLQVKETLYATAQATPEDIFGGADGRATVTGNVLLEAYHTSLMPGRPLIYTRHSLPFEQTVNLTGALGSHMAANTSVRDVAVLSQDNGDGGKIMRAEVQLFTEISAVENTETEVIRDAFTTCGETLDLTRQHVVFRSGTVNEQTAESGKAALVLPEGSPRVKTVLLGFARPVLLKAEQKAGKLHTEGILEATVIYMTDDSDVPVSVAVEEPFRMAFATDAGPDNALQLSVSQVECGAITGDRVEMKYILHLHVFGVTKTQTDVTVAVAAGEAKPIEKGVALYFVQPGDTLWDIARHYRMAVQEICRMNPDVQMAPAPGTPVITYRR